MPATVIAERIGWEHSIRVLRDRVGELRPVYLPPDPAGRTTYVAGELAQCDLWFPPARLMNQRCCKRLNETPVGPSPLKVRVSAAEVAGMSTLGGAGTDPGRGAREQAARAAAQVQEAERKLAEAQRRQAAWEAGAEGERRTAAVLAELAMEGWQVLHDVHWPGRPFANIDHIVIGPGGVVVIDSKNWSGRVDVRDGVLRQNGYRRTEACDGAAQAAAAVAALLQPQHRTLVAAIICLVDQPTPGSQPSQVEVIGLGGLAANLRARKAGLSIAEVHAIGAHLRRALAGRRSPAQTTTAALASAGAAWRDSPRGSTPSRRVGAPGRDAAPARRRGTPNKRRRTDRQDGVVAGVLKLVAILFLVFVALPAWLHGLQDRLENPPATGTTTPTATLSPAP